MTMNYVSFAGSTLAISCTGDSPQRIVSFLFAHLQAFHHGEPHVTLWLRHDEMSGELSLFRDENLVASRSSEGAMAETLLWHVGYHLANASTGGLLLHAAALRRERKAFILPGESGAGKSTLTVWLTHNGFEYLTDELVFVPEKSRAIRAFRRPLKLKSSARPLVEKYFDFSASDGHILRCEHTDLISVALIGGQACAEDVPLGVIIFPRYSQGSDFSLTRITKGRAGLSLMKTFLNARSFPDHGLSEITRLLHDVPAYNLQYGSFAQLDDSLLASLTDVAR
jgi:hypothetical protein